MHFQVAINHSDDTFEAKNNAAGCTSRTHTPTACICFLQALPLHLPFSSQNSSAPLLLAKKSSFSNTESCDNWCCFSFTFGGLYFTLGHTWERSIRKSEVAMARLLLTIHQSHKYEKGGKITFMWQRGEKAFYNSFGLISYQREISNWWLTLS